MLNRTNIGTLTIAFLLAVACLSPCCSAQSPKKKALRREQALEAAGAIDGAIWSFSLKPQKGSGAKGKPALRGKYRISNLEIFQGETPEGELTKKIGTSKIIADKEGTAEFEKIGGYTTDNKWIEMKGKAVMKALKGGAWEGVFIDDEGFKWDMIIRRIQE